LGGFREIIRPGTFARSIRAGSDVKCLFNHVHDNILGRTKSGTLQVEEDSKGLCFRCQLDRNSQAHRDLYSAVKRGDIDECSFAFSVAKGGQSWDEGTDPETGERIAQRTLTDVDLIDVSCVTYPAYNQTSVEGRAKTPDYAGRKFVPQSVTEKLWHARKQMRRAAAMLARPIVEAQKRDDGWDPIQDMASQIRCNLDLAHRFLEAAVSCSAAARLLNEMGKRSDEDGDGFDEDNGYREFKAAHVAAHAAIESASDAMADCRLKASACKRLTVNQIKD